MGKGREIASIILDNVAQGRYRSIWVSLSTALYYDAKRDFRDLGRADINVCPLHKLDTSWTRPGHVLDTSPHRSTRCTSCRTARSTRPRLATASCFAPTSR